ALIEASGFVCPDGDLDPALGELYLEQAMKFAGTGGITTAAWVSLGPLVCTYENVSFESWHEPSSEVSRNPSTRDVQLRFTLPLLAKFIVHAIQCVGERGVDSIPMNHGVNYTTTTETSTVRESQTAV